MTSMVVQGSSFLQSHLGSIPLPFNIIRLTMDQFRKLDLSPPLDILRRSDLDHALVILDIARLIPEPRRSMLAEELGIDRVTSGAGPIVDAIAVVREHDIGRPIEATDAHFIEKATRARLRNGVGNGAEGAVGVGDDARVVCRAGSIRFGCSSVPPAPTPGVRCRRRG